MKSSLYFLLTTVPAGAIFVLGGEPEAKVFVLGKRT